MLSERRDGIAQSKNLRRKPALTVSPAPVETRHFSKYDLPTDMLRHYRQTCRSQSF